jgi:hypothetical protein
MGEGAEKPVDHRIGLRRAIRSIRTRLAAPVGGKRGRVNGFATQAERYAKQRRLQHLEAELVKVEGRLSAARISICRDSHRLAKLRHHLDRVDVDLSVAEWQATWQAKRWSLTADGDGATRPSVFIPSSGGWSYGFRPRWRAFPPRPVGPARTVCSVR